MTPPLMTGPIAPESNPPITPQYYAPRFYYISAITLGQTTIVTTTVDHDYVISQLCRLIIPNRGGCRQLNEKTGYVISIPSSTQVELAIDSSINVNPFTSYSGGTQPQILAIGDINSGPTNSNRSDMQTFISGSFINISPQ